MVFGGHKVLGVEVCHSFQIHIVEALYPNVIVYGNKTFNEVIKVKWINQGGALV